MHAQLDHLVLMADTLDEGVRWCERQLGVEVGPGGRHPQFGTHNRVFSIASPVFPLAYFEIIAIDPAAGPIPRARWFDVDDPTLQRRVAEYGPQLIHWVARVPDLPSAREELEKLAEQLGPAQAASRPTPTGLLQWQITVRDDGRRAMDGCLPTLIAWQGKHPAEDMAASGAELKGLALQHPEPERLRQTLRSLDLNGVTVEAGERPRISATFHTPGGVVTLS